MERADVTVDLVSLVFPFNRVSKFHGRKGSIQMGGSLYDPFRFALNPTVLIKCDFNKLYLY